MEVIATAFEYYIFIIRGGSCHSACIGWLALLASKVTNTPSQKADNSAWKDSIVYVSVSYT